jgi:hypothetical protein
MDTISTALTTAWLDAVHRVRSAAYQHFVQQVPQAKPSRSDRNLTDVIASALQDDGAKPVQAAGPVTASKATDPSDLDAPSASRVDRLV